jgi:hypothetical protein
VLGQFLGRVFAGDDRANDLQTRHAGDVRDNMMKLHVHLHEGLLHVLHVRGRVFDDRLSMTQVCTQAGHSVARAEASSQQSVLVKLL